MRIIGFSLSLILWAACVSDFKDFDKIKPIELDPLLEFPLVDSRIQFADFQSEIEDFTIEPREDGTITLYFQKQLYSALASDYYSFLDQTSPSITIEGLSSGGVPLSGTLQGSASDELITSTQNGESLENVVLVSGTLRFHVYNDFLADVDATLNIPNLSLNNIPFSITRSIAFGDQSFDIDLSGAIIDLSKAGTSVNRLEFTVDALITGNGNPVIAANRLEGYFEIIQPQFRLLYGTAGAREFETQSGTENIDVLGETTATEFRLEEPTVRLEVRNSLGVPVEVAVNTFNVVDQNSNVTALSGTVMTEDNPFLIGAPAFDLLGQAEVTTIELNAENSNLNDIISQIPEQINYDVTAAYPGGAEKIFVMDTSTVIVTAFAELPLYGYLNNLSFLKEVDFDGSIFSNIKEGNLLLTLGNRYPLGVDIVLIFEDGNGTPIAMQPVPAPIIIASPGVDSEGRTSVVEQTELEISLSEEQVFSLQDAVRLSIGITMNTAQGGNTLVRFTEDDFMDLHIGVIGRANF